MGKMKHFQIKSSFLGWLLVLFLMTFPLSTGLHADVINLTQSSGESVWPAVAVNSSGEVIVLWTEWVSGAMWYRVYKNGQWTEKKNSGIIHRRAANTQIEADSSNTFHTSYADGKGSSNRDVYSSKYNGGYWQTADLIYASPYNSAWIKMDVDENNKVHIVWYHSLTSKDDTGEAEIVYMAKSASGSWPTSFENVSRTPNVMSIHPALHVKNGTVHVCYMQRGTPHRIFYCEKSGGQWKTPQDIISGYYPEMRVDSSNNVHVVYSGRGKNLYYISRENGSWKSQKTISNGPSPLQLPDLHSNNSTLVACWSQGEEGDWSIHIAAKTPGGQWGQPIKVADTQGGEGDKKVQVFVDNTNQCHVVWEGNGVGGNPDIFYRKMPIDASNLDYIEVNKSSLEFKTEEGEIPNSKTFQIRASGQNALDYTISSNKGWLDTIPSSGTSSGEWDIITVDVTSGGLQAGEYSGQLTISAAGASNSPLNINVDLTIEPKKTPHILLNRYYLSFSAFARGGNPPLKTFQIKNSGANVLDYELIPNRPWLSVSPKKGKSNNEWDSIEVSVDISGLGVNDFSGEIKITAVDADNKPQWIAVDLEVKKPPQPYSPLNVEVTPFTHEGLMLKIYKNMIEWEKNDNNIGLFHITKYRIYRKEKTFPWWEYVLINETNANTFSVYDGDFASEADRDMWDYAVSCVDADGKESEKSEVNPSATALTVIKRN